MLVDFEGGDWTLIKTRPRGGNVLVNESLGLYAKQGLGNDDTRSEFERYLDISSMGFPVPTASISEDSSYYVETALRGGHMIEEAPRFDKPELLGRYAKVLHGFAVAHIGHPEAVVDIHKIKSNVFLENAIHENPDIDREYHLDSLVTDLVLELPQQSGHTAHGDLSPANIFTDGIIDWEFSFRGGVKGYDLLALPYSGILHGSNDRTLFPEREYDEFLSDALSLNPGEIAQLRNLSLVMKSMFYVSHMAEDVRSRPHKEPLWRKRRGVLATIAGAVLNGRDVNETLLRESVPR